MRMCMRHWEMLKQAVVDRGLSAMISDGGEELVARLASQQEEGITVDNFDPLMYAMTVIIEQSIGYASEAAGQAGVDEITADNNIGLGCPLCFLDMKHKPLCDDEACTGFDEWTQRGADAALQRCEGMKL